MHVHGMGTAADLTTRVKPAIDRIDQSVNRKTSSASTPPSAATPALNGAALAKIIGHDGEQSGPVYKITIGRPDINLREHGAAINSRDGTEHVGRLRGDGW